MKRTLAFILSSIHESLCFWTPVHLVALLLGASAFLSRTLCEVLLAMNGDPEFAALGLHVVITPAGKQYLQAWAAYMWLPMGASLLAFLFLPISSDVTRAFEDSEKLREITQDNDHNAL